MTYTVTQVNPDGTTIRLSSFTAEDVSGLAGLRLAANLSHEGQAALQIPGVQIVITSDAK